MKAIIGRKEILAVVMLFITGTLFLAPASSVWAQSPGGCTDPLASNYNAGAVWNNGSCTYAATSITSATIGGLPAVLSECSGIIWYNGKLYGHQDSGGPASLFETDTNGNLLRTIVLQGITNIDWEDITQDENYIYIGDFGNNVSGNRTDLKIYRFPKTALSAAGTTITVPATSIDVINFSYEGQTNFAAQPGNSTYWDCEAMAVNRGWIHLFSKNWTGNYSIHYVVPCAPGTYTAEKLDSINTAGILVTGADFGADDELILCGYSNVFPANSALFLVYGFNEDYYYFDSGCRRTLNMGTAMSYGQIEGICFDNALHGYIANEDFHPNALVHVTQKLYRFNVQNLIKDYYQHNQKVFSNITPVKGTLRFNSTMGIVEGYDGTHWVKI